MHLSERRDDREDERARSRQASAPASSPILDLQRTAGNAVVTRLLRAAEAAAAPPSDRPGHVEPILVEQMQRDVDEIAEKLKEQVLTAADEQDILDRLEHWARVEEMKPAGADPGTPLLDKLFLLLKLKTFTRATARSMWMDTTVNAFETLFFELEDERLGQFKSVLAKSERHRGSAAPKENTENYWATLGKQEAMGMFGMVKGLGTGLAGIADAGVWAASKWTKAMRDAGLDVEDPHIPMTDPKTGKKKKATLSEYIGSQFDELGEITFGKEFTEGDKLLGGMNAGEIGSAGGGVIWGLTMLGAGGPGAFLGLMGGLKGVEESATNIANLVERMQKDGSFTVEKLLTSGEFWIEATKLGASIFGAVTSQSASSDQVAAVTKATLQRVGILLDGAQLAAQTGRIIEIGASDMPDKEKEAAMGKAVVDAIGTATSIAGQTANYRAEQAKARDAAAKEAEAKKRQELYEQALESARPAAEDRAHAREAAAAAAEGEAIPRATEDRPPGFDDETTSPGASTQAAAADDLPLIDLPDTTVMQAPDRHSADEAETMYRNAVGDTPTREAAIYRNTETGEYIVVQGDDQLVSVGLGPTGEPEAPRPGGKAQRWKELLDGRPDVGNWQLEAHHHPLPSEGAAEVLAADRLPSGANGDVGVLIREALRDGEARTSRLDFQTANGPNDTLFGYDPGADRPLWVDYPDHATGERTTETFATVDEYHDFLKNKFNVDPGDVPDWVRVAEAVSENVPQAQRGRSGAVELTEADLAAGAGAATDERAAGSPGTEHGAGASETRTGTAYNEYNAAEAALGGRWDFDPATGFLRSVEFDLPDTVGNEGTRPDRFTRDPGLVELGAAQPTHDDFNNTTAERGHAAAQQYSGGDERVARVLMQMSNVWAMEGRGSTGVNQGAFKSVEDGLIALKAANPDVSLRVSIVPQLGSPPRTFAGGAGRTIYVPESFTITVVAVPPTADAPVRVREIVVPNVAGSTATTTFSQPIPNFPSTVGGTSYGEREL